MAMYLMSIMSHLFFLLQLLLGSLKLSTYWIIILVVGNGSLNLIFLSTGMAIYFGRLLGNLEHTWLSH